MLKLKRIAITGGIASGKTSVCRVFQELGAFVVLTDTIVHELLSCDADLRLQIVRQLGPDVLVDGKLDRKMIAHKVFKDPEALHALENLLHPAVFHQIEELYQTANRSEKYFAFVVEIPLLYELKMEKLFDIVIAVVADENITRKRFIHQGFLMGEYEQRMNRQIPVKEKAERADYIFENNGSFDHLRKQVIEFSKILNKTITA